MVSAAETVEILPPVDAKLARQAVALDEKIREAVKTARKSFVTLAKLLHTMKTEELWKCLTDKDGKPKFKRLEAYASDVLGDMARSRLYELLAVNQLMLGAKPLSEDTVEELGVKKAAALAQLPESKRTQAVVAEAKKAPTVAKVKEQVRSILNEELPATEKKEATALFARQMPLSIISDYEELEARAVYMEGIRDGDMTLNLKQKVFVALIKNFEANHVEELKEADEYKKKAVKLEKEKAEAEKAAVEAKKKADAEAKKAAAEQKKAADREAAAQKKAAATAERAAKKANGAAKKSSKKGPRKFSADEFANLSASDKQRAIREGRAPE